MKNLIFALFTLNLAAAPLTFDRACEEGESITIGASGDILFHMALQVASRRQGNFSHTWSYIKDAFDDSKVDIMLANLETPTAEGVCMENMSVVSTEGCSLTYGSNNDFFSRYGRGSDYASLMERGFSNNNQLNVSPELIDDLAEFFDVISTATNHAMDRRALGADITLEELRNRGFENRVTGTIHTQDVNPKWHAEMSVKGINIAFIGCTFSNNGLPDRENQVMMCFDGENGSTPNQVFLDEIRKLASLYDAVIALPHWGAEYTIEIDPIRRNLANRIFKSGALAVLGSHPHVIQPWEKLEALEDDLGNTKDRFIIYSLGNFMANQGTSRADRTSVMKRTGMILHLGLTKNSFGTFINGAKYMPYYITAASSGPNGLRQALPLNHPYKDKNTRFKAAAETALNYVEEVLPIENMVLDPNGDFNTRVQNINGQLMSCR